MRDFFSYLPYTANTHTSAAPFGLFAFGMAAGSVQLALINCTTVENLTRKTHVWHLAIRVPESYQPPFGDPSEEFPNSTGFRTVTYPLPQWIPIPTASAAVTDTPTSLNRSASKRTTPEPRTFVVLTSKPGDNPWDLGPLENMKQVLGFRWWEWLLPLKYSPCCNHESQESLYALGPAVERMRKEAGLSSVPQRSNTPQNRERRKSGRAPTASRERYRRSSTSGPADERHSRREKKKRSRSHRNDHDRGNVIR